MKGHFIWSVRREVWEHRSIYVVPLVVAALVLVAYLISLRNLPEQLRLFSQLTAQKQASLALIPYGMVASVILLTAFIVGIFYCLDALNSERRDRSILFWKSMPVSDATTVLSKMAVPVAVLPLVAFAIALATQLILVVMSAALLAAFGVELGALWARLPLFQVTLVMLYGVAVHVLWYAPIHAALLLVSTLAKRAPFLWAVAPVAVAIMLERIAFGTTYLWQLLRYRVVGAMKEAFVPDAMKEPVSTLAQLDPVRFLSAPGLWLGLVFAAACLYAAIRLRRYRDPV